jgi:ABC-type multidrug transport system ATPase subunit
LIAGRKRDGLIAGSIKFPPNTIQAYVTSNDVHIGEFTVQESLYFSAQLRMGAGVSSLEIFERCRSVALSVGLESSLSTVIGTATTKGISGGQMRRLSIATELLASPSLLFLDEPTTGLVGR